MPTLINGRTGAWEVVIGLEAHAQVISESKLFSGAATAFGAGAPRAPSARPSPWPRRYMRFLSDRKIV